MSTDAEPKPKGGAIGALLQRLQGLFSRLKWNLTLPPIDGWRSRVMGLGRTRIIWLAGALLLIFAGLSLALFGGGSGAPSSANESIAIALPPLTPSRVAVLSPAPDQGLIEDTPDGPLPITGKDGRQSWKVYARPFDANDKRPRVALLVIGLGLDRALTQNAMDRLPAVVTLGFDPYADAIRDVMMLARDLGHEAVIGLPLEPLDYPRQDPGPLTLLTSIDEGANSARLNKLMGETSGYVGMVAMYGSRFIGEKTSLLPVLQNLKTRGLMFIDNKSIDDSGTASTAKDMKLPWAGGNRFIDSEADPAAIDQALNDLEGAAKRGGAGLAIAVLSPALLDRAATWAATLEARGVALAPVSAIANRQTLLPPPPPAPLPVAAPAGAPAAAGGHEEKKPAAHGHE